MLAVHDTMTTKPSPGLLKHKTRINRRLADMGGRYEIRMKRGTLFMACDLE